MVRSLRWRLQIWHGLVLAAVLAIFGGIVYAQQWESRLQQVDADLDRTAAVLTSRLRRLIPLPIFRWPQRGPMQGRRYDFVLVPRQDGEGRDVRLAPFDLPSGDFPPTDLPAGESIASRGSRPPTERGRPWDPPVEDPDGAAIAEIPPQRGNFGGGPGGRSPRGQQGQRPPGPTQSPSGPPDPSKIESIPSPGLELPEEFAQIFEGHEDARQYYIIWNREGDVLAKSSGAPERKNPELKLKEDGLPVRVVRTLDGRREVITVSRFEMNVLVGRSLNRDVAIHHASALRLGAVGMGVLGFGLLGGWWSARRATRPIAVMSQTARLISARNISQRIDVAETDDELGELAHVLNQAFDRLESAFKQQTRFTADASHELRTPVSVILANADHALSRVRSEGEYRESLESCRRAAQRMRSLIESLLMLARFDSGKSVLAADSVDVPQLIQETAALVEPLARQREIDLRISASPTLVRGDREQLSQVLVNLLTNAIRYNRDGGTVRIGAAVKHGHAVIAVSDDGIGIPPEHLPRVFDRFYRVDAARSRNDGGSGLGLSICRTIVEAHGGTITAHSEPDHGTTMEVRLPRASEPAATPRPTELAAGVS